jgi:hypothetical protein
MQMKTNYYYYYYYYLGERAEKPPVGELELELNRKFDV